VAGENIKVDPSNPMTICERSKQTDSPVSIKIIVSSDEGSRQIVDNAAENSSTRHAPWVANVPTLSCGEAPRACGQSGAPLAAFVADREKPQKFDQEVKTNNIIPRGARAAD
jgi:hypothetical protein